MRYRLGLLSLAGALLVGCKGGGERAAAGGAPAASTESTAAAPSAAPAAAPAALTMPDWMKVDKGAKTVAMDVQAGKTPDNNHWNFNGYTNGNATITVPAGFKVTIDFKNDDPAVAHSIGVDTRTGNFDATLTPQPAFPNAVSPDPTNPGGGTGAGKSAKVSFTAAKPGHYSMVCYMPGHAAAGMWTYFDVSSDGSAGVTGGK